MPSRKYPLGYYGLLALDHWREHRPRMYADLEASGELEKAAYEAQEKTRDEMRPLLRAGVNQPTAWEAVSRKYILLPSEEEEERQSDEEDGELDED